MIEGKIVKLDKRREVKQKRWIKSRKYMMKRKVGEKKARTGNRVK